MQDFLQRLDVPDLTALIRGSLIGHDNFVPGHNGPHRLVYADYTASGRASRLVEDFILEEVLPFYANTHTDASYCGQQTGRHRESARETIRNCVGANQDHAVIFCGSGATAAINKFVSLTQLHEQARTGEIPVVFIGPYEHHSNILPWRESGADVVEIPEAETGGPDLTALETALIGYADRRCKIGSFSAASNVTGILTDVTAVTQLLKSHGALATWDYAGGGPYLPISMQGAEGAELDAIFLSPHKFIGGPGASGVLVVRKSVATRKRPSHPGGGTVDYVSSWDHRYFDSVEDREESGTPNILGDIRAGLVFELKQQMGTDLICSSNARLADRAIKAWQDQPRLKILGLQNAARLPVFSVLIFFNDGQPVHHNLVARILNDRYGIQARAGCACAGPYGHHLLKVSQERSIEIRDALLTGQRMEKPGWVRLNLSFLMDDAEADFILGALTEVSNNIDDFARDYVCDRENASYFMAM